MVAPAAENEKEHPVEVSRVARQEERYYFNRGRGWQGEGPQNPHQRHHRTCGGGGRRRDSVQQTPAARIPPPEDTLMTATPTDRLTRWRLLLGKTAEEELRRMGCAAGLRPGGAPVLSGDAVGMDEALEMTYPGCSEGGQSPDLSREEWEGDTSHGRHSSAKGRFMPRVARWLDQIRTFFPTEVVALLQKDAIERRGLKELLFEPETLSQVEPSLDLVGTLLSLKNLVPDKAKDAAREIVRKVVEELKKRLANRVEQAIRGALDRSRHSPIRSLPNMDWQRTIRRNLKNYNRERRVLIPETFHFFSRQQRRNQWNIIIAMDQSGSMATSLIYGGVMGAILASIPAVETHVVAFNHEDIVDLTEHCQDPVDLLFGIQLGGAEDYWMATKFCEQFMHTPKRTLYILLADLYDTSPNEAKFVRKMEELLAGGIKAIGLLAISDRGTPSFNERLARKLGEMGMPCFGCTPERLPDLLEASLKGDDLSRFAKPDTRAR
jgi:hypothetical protein